MNKKFIRIGIIGGFILITGICYSMTFVGCSSRKTLSTSLSEDNNEDGNNGNQDDKRLENQITPEVTAGAFVTGAASKKVTDTKIYVHICGFVKKPGVYQVKAGSRICNLIKLSGGLKKDAAGDYINQAEQVTDGQRIYIPSLDEVKNITPQEYLQEDTKSISEGKGSGLVNINSATAEELMTIPGIGQAKADSIIDYRTKNGSFKSIEDLMNISGIKEGIYNRISSYITVN